MRTEITLPSVPAQPIPALTLAPPAGFGRRVGALVLDWLLLFFLVPGIAMLVVIVDEVMAFSTNISDAIFLTVTIAFVVGAFTVSYLLGATPGMLAVSIRVVDAANGKHIGLIRAFVRAGLAFLLVASWFWVFNVFIFSDARVDGRSSLESVLDVGALGFFLAGILGRLWILVDQHDQTLFDRILRIQVIGKPARPE
jgi:uncharacterized RDD family membrane protein YckC